MSIHLINENNFKKSSEPSKQDKPPSLTCGNSDDSRPFFGRIADLVESVGGSSYLMGGG